MKDEDGYMKTPWFVIGVVLAVLLGAWVGTHYFWGCSSLLDGCVVVKK